MRAHGTILLITPWWIPLIIIPLPEEPSPVPESLLLTWNPSFACGATPVHSGPRLLVNWPPPSPFPPHSLFLPPMVPHFNHVPFYDDITTPTSYSPIQLYHTIGFPLMMPCQIFFQILFSRHPVCYVKTFSIILYSTNKVALFILVKVHWK
jgi:hypothetical protein